MDVDSTRQLSTTTTLLPDMQKSEEEVSVHFSPTLSRGSRRKENDIERLKQRIELLLKSNEEKERQIEQLEHRISEDRSMSIHSPPICNPLDRLKLHVFTRANSADRFSFDLADRPNGYLSDGTRLDKSKSTSSKGLRNLFGKLIRTQSSNFRDLNDRRTSLKSSFSTPKIEDQPMNALELTFARWSNEQLIRWLLRIGLGQYADECRKYFHNGLQLLQATPQELEKKIGMKNPLHRKKLQLCLNGLCVRQTDGTHLDLHWVQKWLEDIGLSQYKDSFAECQVDGRMLNNLSQEDISYLNINSEIHFLTLKHSIQVLRLNHFSSNFIQRRSSPLDINDTAEIMHWSNHRVMEWLRSIDLAEYAPNLRGSGVCGALIILELRFNSSTLADILSIPICKTLLRRHLARRFEELIGENLSYQKNDSTNTSCSQPLTTQTKIKVSRGLFTPRRTRSIDVNDLICPLPSYASSPALKRFPMQSSTSINDKLVRDSPSTFV